MIMALSWASFVNPSTATIEAVAGFRYDPPMTDRLTIALAQLNPTLGAINANLAKAREARATAKDADIILFPELFICGYPPEDLVLRPTFVAACKAAVEDLAKDTITGPAVLMGLPWRDGGKLHNAVALLAAMNCRRSM